MLEIHILNVMQKTFVWENFVQHSPLTTQDTYSPKLPFNGHFPNPSSQLSLHHFYIAQSTPVFETGRAGPALAS